jgi:hypothetical protein
VTKGEDQVDPVWRKRRMRDDGKVPRHRRPGLVAGRLGRWGGRSGGKIGGWRAGARSDQPDGAALMPAASLRAGGARGAGEGEGDALALEGAERWELWWWRRRRWWRESFRVG